MRNASVVALAKSAHTESAVLGDGGNVALVRTLSPVSPFWETSIDRESDPKHAAEVPGKPTIDLLPPRSPLSSPHLSISHRKLPAAFPYGVLAHHAGLPC